MPIYEVTAPDGRRLKLEAETIPPDSELDQLFAEAAFREREQNEAIRRGADARQARQRFFQILNREATDFADLIPPDTGEGPLKTVAENLAAGMIGTVAKGLKGAAVVTTERTPTPHPFTYLVPPEQRPTRPEENPLYRAGAALERVVQEQISPNPRYRNSFWLSDVPQGLGSTIGFLPAAIGGGAGIALAGALASGGAAYDEAMAAGADEETATRAFFINALAGTTEAVPLERILSRINRRSGGSLARAVRDLINSGLEEGAQETFQQLVGNLVAKFSYDPERKYLEDVARQGAAGGVAGLLITGLGLTGRQLLPRPAQPPGGPGATTTPPNPPLPPPGGPTLPPGGPGATELKAGPIEERTGEEGAGPVAVPPVPIGFDEILEWIRRARTLDELEAITVDPGVRQSHAGLSPIEQQRFTQAYLERVQELTRSAPGTQPPAAVESAPPVPVPAPPAEVEPAPPMPVPAPPAEVEPAPPMPVPAPVEVSETEGRSQEEGALSKKERRYLEAVLRLYKMEGTPEELPAARIQAEDYGKDLYPIDRQELNEVALVVRARELVLAGGDVYENLVRLYEQSRMAGERDLERRLLQQYSTPPPLAYLAARLADFDEGRRFADPTAGHAMLMIGIPQRRGVEVLLNELSRARAARLGHLVQKYAGLWPGNRVEQQDALQPDFLELLRRFKPDRLALNPPYGIRLDAEGRPMQFVLENSTLSDARTSQLEWAIALNSLTSLSPTGKAFLIMKARTGTPFGSKFGSEAERARAYEQPEFLDLLNRFRVRDWFTVVGDLYRRMGAAWPVDVIIVEGIGPTPSSKEGGLVRPWVRPPRVHGSWRSLKQLLRTHEEAKGKVTYVREQSRTDVGSGLRAAGAGPGLGPEAGHGGGGLGAGGAGVGPGRSQSGTRAGGSRAGVGEAGAPAGAPRGGVGAGGSPAVPGGGAEAGRATSALPVVERGGGHRETAGGAPAVLGEKGERAPADRGGESRELTGTEERQVPYKAVSGGGALNLLAPRGLADAMQAALRRLEQETGQTVDEFVAGKLGREVAVLHQQLSAAQIDAVALAIYQIERGSALTVADEGGVGKGRVIAALIVYAQRRGLIPVFVTATRHQLYSDMLSRDMPALGILDFKPLITDSDAEYFNGRGEWKVEHAKAKDKARLFESIASAGQLPAEYDGIFTTYSQLGSDKPPGYSESGRNKRARLESGAARSPGARLKMLDALASRALFLLDESHKAAGTTSEVFLSLTTLLPKAAGVYFSSATYAKRAENLALYAMVNGLKHLSLPTKKLVEFLEGGGYPLQQVAATMMARAGELVRRQQNWAGVEFHFRAASRDAEAEERAADRYTEFLRRLLALEPSIRNAAKTRLNRENQQRDVTQQISLEKTTFSSRLFNLSNVYLLSLRAPAVVDAALEALKSGRKPFIMLQNTMENPILELQSAGLPISFNGLLLRELQQILHVKVRDPLVKGGKSTMVLNPNEHAFGDEYAKLWKDIEEADLSQFNISPIDFIIQELRAAGYRVGEITARETEVNESGEGMTVSSRELRERSLILRAFNDGELDAVVVNGAGSTGISAHSSPTFKDRRQREGIVAQPALDINEFMQILWRIKRTGQLSEPRYTVVTTRLAVERRFSTLLRRKMSSLNANTTADTGSAFTEKSEFVPDIFNIVGNLAVKEVMQRHPEAAGAMGIEPVSEGREVGEDYARKITGRFVLLKNQLAEKLWQEIYEAYEARLNALRELGFNPLEAEVLDLQAETLESGVLEKGRGGGEFGGAVNWERIRYRPPGVVMSAEEALAEAERNRGKIQKELADWLSAGRNALNEALREVEAGPQTAAQKRKLSETLRHNWERVQEMAVKAAALPGQIIGVAPSAAGKPTYLGVVVNLRLHGASAEDYRSASRQILVVRLNGAKGKMSLPLSQVFGENALVVFGSYGPKDYNAGLVRKNEGYIITGNILRGYRYVREHLVEGQGGAVILFRRRDGRIEPGIMMPAEWMPRETEASRQTEIIRNEADFERAVRAGQELVAVMGDNVVMRIEPGLRVRVKSNTRGRFLWGNPNFSSWIETTGPTTGPEISGKLNPNAVGTVWRELERAGARVVAVPAEPTGSDVSAAMRTTGEMGEGMLAPREPGRLPRTPRVPPGLDHPDYSVFPMEMPEAVELVEELMAGRRLSRQAVQLRERLRGALGRFRARGGRLQIELERGLWELSPEELDGLRKALEEEVRRAHPEWTEDDVRGEVERQLPVRARERARRRVMHVFWHEIGHLVDWLPEGRLRRGNIFGHLAAVHRYLRRVFPHPAPRNRTERERFQIGAVEEWRANRGDLEERLAWEFERDSSLERAGLTVERAVEAVQPTAREAHPEWWVWFAAQTPEFQGSLLAEALREMKPGSGSAGLRGAFVRLLQQHAAVRLEELQNELRGLVRWWRDAAMERMVSRDPVEMYAEALSAFFNNPGAVSQRAPTFYRMVHDYMDRRPRVAEEYARLQDLIRRGQVDAHQAERLRASWRKEEAAALEFDRARGTHRRGHVLDNVLYHIDRVFGPLYRRARRSSRPAAVRRAIGDYIYRAAEHELFLTRVEREVGRVIEGAGLLWDDLAELMFHQQIIENRQRRDPVTGVTWELPNPGGWTAERSGRRLAELEQILGPDRWAALTQAREQLRRIYEELVVWQLADSGLASGVLLEAITNRVHYAPLLAARGVPAPGIDELLESSYGRYSGSHLYRQVGNLGSIRNPATAFVLQSLGLISAAHRNRLRREFVRVMLEVEPEMIRKADQRWVGNHREWVVRETDKVGTVFVVEQGQAQAWYVPAELADMVNQQPMVRNWLTLQVQRMTVGLKAIFTQLNYGFWPVAFARDALSWLLLMPGVLTPVHYLRFLPSSLAAARDSVRKSRANPLADAALRRKMLISRASPAGFHDRVESEYELALASYGINPTRWGREVSRQTLWARAWQAWKNTGVVLERSHKIAGMRYLDAMFPEMPEWKKQEIVRERAGSPDFLQRPASNPYLDLLAMFYNPWKESLRSLVKAARENPWSFTAKTVSLVMLPTVLQAMSVAGFFGDDWAEAYGSISDYDLTNYLNVPVAWANRAERKVIHLRLPLPEPARILHGLVTKLLTGRGRGYGSYMGGQLPGLNPIIDVALAWTMYEVAGVNPYDSYRGNFWLQPDVAQAGGLRARIALLKESWNRLGGSFLGSFRQARLDEPPPERLESWLRLPFVSNLLGRWIKVSNQGWQDRARAIQRDVDRERASMRVVVREIVRKLQAGEALTESERILMRDPYAQQHFLQVWPTTEKRRLGSLEYRLLNRAHTREARRRILMEERLRGGGGP